MDELVDVVDENDIVVGQKMKNECHKNGVRHRVVGILLFNKDGDIWLQSRSKEKTVSGRYLDFSASGHVPSGEDYEESAYREMQEELGIKTFLRESLNKIFEYHKYRNDFIANHVIKLFTGVFDGEFSIQKDELSGIKSYKIEEVKKLLTAQPPIFTEGLRLVLIKYFEFKDV